MAGGVRCKWCGREIRYIVTAKNGKAMPCDVLPVAFYEAAGGRERLVLASGRVVAGSLAPVAGVAPQMGFVSHFASCPAAARRRTGT